jgi:hypothetical protein
MMKRENMLAQVMLRALLLSLISCACCLAALAQTVTPRVCVEPNYQTGMLTLSGSASAGDTSIRTDPSPPQGQYSLVINPGGANEERIPLSWGNSIPILFNADMSRHPLTKAHSAGEAVQWISDLKAHFGYNNSGTSNIKIQPGSAGNFFSPGSLSVAGQTSTFLPGINENAFSILFISTGKLTWALRAIEATVTGSSALRCGTITYQGRLSEAGNPANGQYDLQFTAYDALTGGTAQTSTIVAEDVKVSGGIFTAQLNFGSSLTGNDNARFLEIGVRPGTATVNDPFTVLQPRQPITSVPYAINAQNAASATTAINATNAMNATNADKLGNVAASNYVQTNDSRLSDARPPLAGSASYIQNTTTPQTADFNISGSGALGGNLTVSGAVNANSLSGNGTGLTGIFSFYSLNSSIGGALPANPSDYAFVGITYTLTLTASQRLTGAGSIPLATNSETDVVSVGLCYQIDGGAITNFAGSGSTNTIVDPTYKIYAASASVIPGAGSVRFGLCVGKNSQPLASNNANGWVMMTNN